MTMPKIWKKDHPIPWLCNESEDEFIADIGKYRLQVVKKGSNFWQWRVYHLDERLETRLNEVADNKHRALGLAEGLYLGHESIFRDRDPEIRFFRSSI